MWDISFVYQILHSCCGGPANEAQPVDFEANHSAENDGSEPGAHCTGDAQSV